jgi:predicted TIM-barrel fold metal-dependent hydrolase
VKIIDLENHFITQDWVDAMYANTGYPRFVDAGDGKRRLYAQADEFEPAGDILLAKLLDLGEGRIKAMDAVGVDVAVLSMTSPGVEHFEPELGARLARGANDALAAAIAAHPDRFQGLASVAFKDVDGAVVELERAVKELGLRGIKTHSNFGRDGGYIDDKRYWPILAKCEELGVPVYLHPAAPMIDELRTYGLALAGAAFGFGVDTATTMMRLILSGAFDAFPKLMIILGHYGETLPFLMQRVDHPFVRPFVRADGGAVPDLKKTPSQYLRDNMYVTTSGNYLPAAFRCTQEALGMDRIALGTDHPYEDMDECMAFLAALELSDADQAALYTDNAAALGFTA